MRSQFIPLTGLAGLLLLGSSDAACTGNRCVADNCNRQVVASAFTTRQTRADCSSYLATTVTPSAVTISLTVTAAETSAVTVTETVVVTSLTTETDTVPVTAVSTEIVTVTQDVFETITADITSVLLVPRIATGGVSALPAYASSCTAPGQYSSACSCIGVHPFTVTAAAPSTTVTITAHPTVTVTQSATLSTLVAQTQTTVQTVTTTDVVSESVTVTQTHTVTVSPPACTPVAAVFQLQYTSGDGTAILLRTATDGSGSGPIYLVANRVTSPASATQFSIAPDGRLLDTGDSLFGGDPAYAYTNFDSAIDTIKFARDNSIRDPDNFITCSLNEATSSFSCSGATGSIMSLSGNAVQLSYFPLQDTPPISLVPVIVTPAVTC